MLSLSLSVCIYIMIVYLYSWFYFNMPDRYRTLADMWKINENICYVYFELISWWFYMLVSIGITRFKIYVLFYQCRYTSPIWRFIYFELSVESDLSSLHANHDENNIINKISVYWVMGCVGVKKVLVILTCNVKSGSIIIQEKTVGRNNILK